MTATMVGCATPGGARSAVVEGPPNTPSPSAPTTTTIDESDISCDTMLTAEAAAELHSRALEPAEKAWSQFGFRPPGAAAECPWGRPGDSTAQVFYAWAALDAQHAQSFLDLVQANGYRVEPGVRGSWVQAPPELEGGGALAILVTVEWVAYAPSREQIDDIVWTR
jgi:hypothetical protein